MSDRTDRQRLMAEHARAYRAMGYNPLPSRADVKRPAMKEYAGVRDAGIPDWMLDKWWGDNIQIATGIRWNLLVVDLDGPEARRVWNLWCRRHGEPTTWTVERDEHSSRHLWFAAPAGLERAPTSVLWGVRNRNGVGWTRGSKVELLGDAGLVIAPPSRHAKTGQPYRWVVGPDQLDRPAPLPDWVRSMIPVRSCNAVTRLHAIPYRPAEPARRAHHDKVAVMAALDADLKLLLAQQFGVRFASERPNAAGWCRCYRDADDRNPSASFNVESGYFWAAGGQRSSLFELGVRAGAYPDLCTAIDTLGDWLGVQP